MATLLIAGPMFLFLRGVWSTGHLAKAAARALVSIPLEVDSEPLAALLLRYTDLAVSIP